MNMGFVRCILDESIKVDCGSWSYPSVDCTVRTEEGDDVLEVAFDFGRHCDALCLVL